jgi:transcription initiation factor TFIIF subunit beta
MSDDEQGFSRKRKAEHEELFEEGDEAKENFEDEDEMVDEDGNVVGDLDLALAGTQAWLVKVGRQCFL